MPQWVRSRRGYIGYKYITNWGMLVFQIWYYYKFAQTSLQIGAKFLANRGGYYKLKQLYKLGQDEIKMFKQNVVFWKRFV